MNLKDIEINSIPKTAFVLFNNGAFGGAEKRFSSLFRYLYEMYPDRFYYFVNNHLAIHINRIYPDFPKKNIRIVDYKETAKQEQSQLNGSEPVIYKDTIPDPVETDKHASWARKVYWFGKNKYRQRHLFKNIDKFKKELGVEVLIGVFSGILPLLFYLKQKPRTAAVIFSDMDSWFSDVHSDMAKLWYRKYYSFNYALENADLVDFLSPYIIDGVKKRNVKLDEKRISVTACSATDYSKCHAGSKEKFGIAFCSRLEPDKNPLLFLHAAKEILKDSPDIIFHLLGEGSLVNEVRKYISENGMKDSVNFLFHKNPPVIFASTSVFVSLQTGTNYPSQSVIEAMACQNAVIASNTGDTSLLVNESNGLLVDLTVSSVTAAMRSLINDREKTKQLGLRGREFVMREHTIEKEAAYYLNLFARAKNLVSGAEN